MASSMVRPEAALLSKLYHGDQMTIGALAARYGVAAQTMHNWLVDARVPRRPAPATARSDIDDRQLVELYTRHGHTAAEIAEQLGCSTSLVYDRLARTGVPRRSRAPRHRGRPADSELAHLYDELGLSLRQLAQRYGVSPQAVHGWLTAAGIPRHPPGTAPALAPGDDVVGLYQAGWSAPAIAEQLGCSAATVYRRLDAAGIARRRVNPRLTRHQLNDALDHGLSAPAMAARFGVSVACVCRALAREGLMTASQAAKQQRHLRYPDHSRKSNH
jgi:transposase